MLLVLFASAVVISPVGATSTRGASPAPQSTALSDDFTHDTALNAALWEINGPVGSAFGAVSCPSCALISLEPSFSSAGMEIAQVNASNEVGTVQSVDSFAPPLTVTARVEGAVSNGHPFVFALASSGSSSGVQITGNLNPNDCSNETNCGNPATCGTPANPSIPANQCYYGIYARVGTGGSWPKTPDLNLTPSVDVVYTLQIAVDGSGNAQYNVSLGGRVLGESTAQVGVGPFSIILAQSEGAPVPGPGPNQAFWLSVSLTPSATFSAPSPSGSSPSGLSSIEWSIILIVMIALLIAVILLAYRRRRGLTVRVLDSGTLSPVLGAGVSADGPENLSGSTGKDGRIVFGGAKGGDYSVKAGAVGFAPSMAVTVSVKKTAQHTVRLDRVAPSAHEGVGGRMPPEGSNLPSQGPSTAAAQPVPPTVAPAMAPPGPAPSPPLPPGLEGAEGWGGERVREIVRTFQAKGAISPQTALTAEELGLSRIFVRIMKRRNGKTRVFVEVNGRYYLDENALQGMK